MNHETMPCRTFVISSGHVELAVNLMNGFKRKVSFVEKEKKNCGTFDCRFMMGSQPSKPRKRTTAVKFFSGVKVAVENVLHVLNPKRKRAARINENHPWILYTQKIRGQCSTFPFSLHVVLQLFGD